MKLCRIILIVMTLKTVAGQICNETISVSREVPETYQYTYFEAYEGNDCYLRSWCTRSRHAVNIGTRLVEKIVNETVHVCCEGYVEDDDNDGMSLKCTPLCDPPCHNGYCKKPNECACEVGYAIDPYELQNQCVPLCLEGCGTPYCFSTCSKDDDHEADPDLCFGTCLNGTCVAPGICHCDPGFKRLSNSCVPVCPSCDHGRCVAPGHCKCDPGWHDTHGSCMPVCIGCEHGTCLAPGQCECFPGYRAQNGKCELHCDCANGNCVSPGVCVCEAGWYMNERGTECLAHCDMTCGHGKCVAHNKCECDTGYRIEEPQSQDSEEPMCVPECSNCEGVCIAPGVCRCDAQYETIHTTADGSECCIDCVSTVSSNEKCDRTVCKRIPEKSFPDAQSGINESEFLTESRTRVQDVIPNIVLNGTSVDDNLDILTNNTVMSCVQMTDQHAIFHWIYACIIIVELIVFILVITTMKRTKMFVPQDKLNEAAVCYNSGSAKLEDAQPKSP